MGRSVKVELILDALKFKRGADEAKRGAKDLGDALDDTARDADKAGRKIDDAGDDMSDSARAASTLDRKIKELTGSLRDMAVAQALGGDFAKQIRAQETELRRVTKNRKLLSDDDAEKMGIDLGGRIGVSTVTGFFGEFGASFKNPPPQIYAGVGVLVAAIAPTIGAGIAGAVVGGIGVGGMVGGLALAARDPEVKAAGSDLGKFILGDLEARAQRFVDPALGGISRIRSAWVEMGPDLDRVFNSSRFVAPMTEGIIAGTKKVVSGAADAVDEASPVIDAFARGIDRIGGAVGDSFSLLAGDADEGASAIDDLTMATQNFILTGAGVVHNLAQIKGGFDAVDTQIDRFRYYLEDSANYSHTFVKSLDLTADGFKKGSVEAEAYRRVTLGTATASDYALIGQQGLAAGLDQTQIEMLKGAEAAQTAKEKTAALATANQLLKGSFEALAPGASQLKSLVDGLKQAQDALFGATMRGAEAGEAWEASWDSVSASVTKNGDSLSVHTEKGRANRDSLEALIGKTNELYFAEIETGMSIDDATKKHGNRIAAVKEEARRVGLNKVETDKLIKTYGQIPTKKGTDLFLEGMKSVVNGLMDVYLLQRASAEGKTVDQIRGGLGRSAEAIKGRYHSGGWTGPGSKYEPAGVVHADEFVIKKESRQRIERQQPGLLAEMNATGQAPGYADGGYVNPAFAHSWGNRIPYDVNMRGTHIMSKAEALSKVMPNFGNWPSSPGAQRGDSGVWKRIVQLIRGTGPLSGSFGNAYRAGDPLWHGCVPMDTLILTRRGWITYDEVVVGEDETVGYNPATGKNEWTLIVGLQRYEDAEVWKLQNSWFTAEVTPGHKWLVDQQVTVQTETACTECGREFPTGRGMTKHRADVHGVLTPRRERYEEQLVATRDFKQSTRIHLSKPADLGDQLPITDDEAELIGWIFGDGYMEPYGPTIVQSKPEQVHYLQSFMAQFPCSEYIRHPEGRQVHLIHRWKLSVGYWNDLASRSKASKDDALNFVFSLSASQREAFVRGFLSADGTRDPRTQNDKLGYAAFQVSGPVAEAIKVAAYLEGYRPDTRVKTEFDADHHGTQPMEHIGFRTSIVKSRNLPVVGKRTADVWCPTTTLGTWTARQGEEIFLTGNSGRAVDWMGYNQDALASFLAAKRPLELIHRSNSRDYAYTRGRNQGSFNNSLMEAHRNHVHIAMANGGTIREPVFGYGASGRTYSFGERGPETVTPGVGGGRLQVSAGSGGRPIEQAFASMFLALLRTGNLQLEVANDGSIQGKGR